MTASDVMVFLTVVKKINSCGYCLNSSIANWDSYGKDCRGICNGGYTVDGCGNCLSPDDSQYNACKYAQGDTHTTTSKSSINTTVLAVIVVCSLIFVAGAGWAVWKMYKRQQDMDKKWSEIAKSYQLMDNSGKLRTKNREMVQVPDEDPEERDNV